MARNKSFYYDEFNSATQDFLRSKLSNIKSLMKPGFKDDCSVLYKIGRQISEVQDKLVIEAHFVSWLNNEFFNIEEFGKKKYKPPTAYDYMKLYNYASEFLENAAGLEANLTAPSVLYLLGNKKTPNSIKQEFAARINSGDKIFEREVKEAIANKRLKTIPYNQIDDLEKPLIEIKELLNSKDNTESKYHKWLKKYYWIFGLDYTLIESHRNLDDKRIPDFTGIRIHDNCRDIFEIKPPFIPLFQRDGGFTSEFNRAWNQVEEYLSFVIEDKDYLRRNKGLDFDNPKCYLILGYDLSSNQIRKIKTKEKVNSAINFRTYDNLIAWAENTIKFVKTHKSRK